jgi:hypothetical protein
MLEDSIPNTVPQYFFCMRNMDFGRLSAKGRQKPVEMCYLVSRMGFMLKKRDRASIFWPEEKNRPQAASLV